VAAVPSSEGGLRTGTGLLLLIDCGCLQPANQPNGGQTSSYGGRCSGAGEMVLSSQALSQLMGERCDALESLRPPLAARVAQLLEGWEGYFDSTGRLLLAQQFADAAGGAGGKTVTGEQCQQLAAAVLAQTLSEVPGAQERAGDDNAVWSACLGPCGIQGAGAVDLPTAANFCLCVCQLAIAQSVRLAIFLPSTTPPSLAPMLPMLGSFTAGCAFHPRA
jgi:hypothetical protein